MTKPIGHRQSPVKWQQLNREHSSTYGDVSAIWAIA